MTLRFPRWTCVLLGVGLLHSLVEAEEPEPKVSRVPLVLKEGGTAENPAIYDGKGMVIDLGQDVTDHDWTKEGDVWTSKGSVAGTKPVSPGQNTALFVDEIPITLARKGGVYLPASELAPGKMGVKEDGSFYFRWPAGKTPGQARIFSMPRAGASCVTIACSYITVKNITAIHAPNDGFNIHNAFVGIRLENIKAISNADEGISAHETVQMDVDGAEIAWNGSFDGGVADVDDSVTTYTNIVCHDNVGLAAFKFHGKKHRVSNSVIYHSNKEFEVAPDTYFQSENIRTSP